MTALSVLILFVWVSVCFSQNYQTDPFTLEGQGNVLTFRLVLGEKSAKLFLVGKEAAKLQFEKDAKLIQITAFRDDQTKEELTFVPGAGYYTIPKLPEWTTPYTFDVRARLKNTKEDSAKIQVKGRLR